MRVCDARGLCECVARKLVVCLHGATSVCMWARKVFVVSVRVSLCPVRRCVLRASYFVRGACLAHVSAGVRFVCSVHFGVCVCACIYARVLCALRGVVRSVGVCCVYVSVLCGARCVVHVRVSCVVCARALRLLCAGASCVGFVVCLRRVCVCCVCVCVVIVSSVCVRVVCALRVVWCVVRVVLRGWCV